MMNSAISQPSRFDADIRRGEAQSRTRSMRAMIMFIALTFCWTWSLWAISTAIKPQTPVLSKDLFLAAGFGPSFAAIVVVLMFGGMLCLRDWLRRCLAWRVRAGWYGVAFFAAPLAMLVAFGVHRALGGNLPALPTAVPVSHVIAAFGLVLIIGGPLGEEFGWRGYQSTPLSACYPRCCCIGRSTLGRWSFR
jgi:uncharacterized protein